MKKIIMLLMLLILSPKLWATDVVYIGTHAEFAPFEYFVKDEIVGFDIDLLEAISKDTGIKFKVVDMSFEGLLPALYSKKVDLVVAGMTMTEERKKSVLFSDPYFKAKQVVITKGENEKIKAIDDLIGKKVGVVLGYTGDTIASGIEGIKLKKFNAAYSAILALLSEKIDAVILDSEPAKHFVEKNKGLYINDISALEEDYAIAGRKNEKELMEKINGALIKIRNSGEYDKLLEKHFK